jgi:5'-methylthioinosine phosphorylase
LNNLAIIGGTGLTSIPGLSIVRREMVKTPYGAPSGPLIHGELCGRSVVFLARHGHHHSIPPHRINYRANIWALKEVGVEQVIAVAAVGGIGADCYPARIVVPDQIIDYTYSRKHTFFDGSPERVEHIDFSYPYSQNVREALLMGAQGAGVDAVDGGCYGATQGPRLETAAEIRRLERDGCTLVGMTGMPEAALAREVELDYACCALVANWAAGKEEKPIDMAELEATVNSGIDQARSIIEAVLKMHVDVADGEGENT